MYVHLSIRLWQFWLICVDSHTDLIQGVPVRLSSIFIPYDRSSNSVFHVARTCPGVRPFLTTRTFIIFPARYLCPGWLPILFETIMVTYSRFLLFLRNWSEKILDHSNATSYRYFNAMDL